MVLRIRTRTALGSRPTRHFSTFSLTRTSLSYNHQLSLPDGRQLGFATYGNERGYPLFFFHGFPGSRFEAAVLDPLARTKNLLLISPDRPGFGLSTYQPGRTIPSWPSDVLALADSMQLDRFSVLGGSGGGPYALACAHSIPRNRLDAVGVLAGAPPWEGGEHHMSVYRRWFRTLATKYPSGTRFTLDLLVSTLRRIVSTKPAQGLIDRMIISAQGASQEKKNVQDVRESILRGMFEAFAQGSEAVVQETILLTQDWRIPLSEITHDQLFIWHGTKDANAPLPLIRRMAQKMPTAQLDEYEDSHYTIARNLDSFLDQLVPGAGAAEWLASGRTSKKMEAQLERVADGVE